MRYIIITLLFVLSFTTSYGQSISDYESHIISSDIVINEHVSEGIVIRPENRQPILDIYTTLTDFSEEVGINCSDGELAFEEFFRPSLNTTSCGPVVTSLQEDNCFDPGELEEGFAVTVSDGSNVVWIPVGTFNNPDPFVGPGAFAEFGVISFDPPVYAVAMDYVSTEEGPSSMRVFGEGNILIESIDYDTDSYDPTFFGVIANEPIESIELEAPNFGGELFGKFYFGGDCLALSVESNLKELISVYPNPVNDELNIKVLSNIAIESVEIYDTVGRLVILESGNNQVNLSKLTTGVYFVTITTSHGKLIEKIEKI